MSQVAANAVKMNNTNVKPALRAKDKARWISLIVMIGALIIALVIISAYIADIKYEINQTIKANATLQGEIENLNVKIKSASSISTVEERATKELGMVYPNSDQYIYLGAKTGAEGAMSMIIIDQAYN